MIPGARSGIPFGPKKQYIFNKGDDIMKKYSSGASGD